MQCSSITQIPACLTRVRSSVALRGHDINIAVMSSLSVAGYSGMHVANETEIRYSLDIKIVLIILEVYTVSLSPSQNSPLSPGTPFEFPVELESTCEFVFLKEICKATGLLAKQVIFKACGCWVWLPKGSLSRTVPAPDSTCPHICVQSLLLAFLTDSWISPPWPSHQPFYFNF